MEKGSIFHTVNTESRVRFPVANPHASPRFPREPFENCNVVAPKSEPGPVTWLSLPRKDQLAILFLCRMVDFLQIASLQAYVFYQLKSFDASLSDAAVSTQAGLLQGCFTGAQVLTAVLWGKAADARWCGRKRVLLIGLGGTAVSCIGYGFATTFFWAAFWRVVGGGINGTVGIIRTMIAEITKEKKYQSRAFLILPMSFNVAAILGPMMGGLLVDPATNLPEMFGPGAFLGFSWVQKYPYALPSVLNALFLSITTCIVFFGLEETLKARRGRFDLGLHLKFRLSSFLRSKSSISGYSRLQTWDGPEPEMQMFEAAKPRLKRIFTQTLPFRRIWTRNVIFTLVAGAFYDFHLGAFANLWTLFLSSPRCLATEPPGHRLPFAFTGGLGMPASTVGLATSILGLLGMVLQIFLYPPVHARLGTLRSFRAFLLLFPLAYFCAPYLSILPSSTAAPAAAAGALIWIGITFVLLLQVTARTFTLPASIILLNNCSPHPSVLGTLHGVGQSVSAAFRTLGPVVGGWWYGAGLEAGVIGAGWWGVAGISGLGCVAAFWLYEGSGHEILLDGEEAEALLGRREIPVVKVERLTEEE
ncbi:MFS transporter [Drepanopeziza brunnea f. sp. 'multigermtubi' MB_m1]|uniref:MFS transporter n=1 Tax=Marssonina brunnea f. sp. multigermtubi (strain MB_m1) TaxID=1072389 RepID=K1Y3H1_MARBU|nr:MFS transporter [Drepanopeziza brunnea f. sp. 'multigermtubi' MB_m1]EKD19699.1 MFS transporter [Drepanopeziza brunnea f. sp. 'multigermtubi' MB_m1]